ncbi:hypothetical protein FA13DRAFT_1714530 [Coprinellus micaceus]|uniref:Uncharacterized protein n=1 Tax=Coprinellus micaceus TaxID=71717 RepID=A0A4Y7SS68_COPMI|nr:hypothetical protein FA13DRAFT_1714530 [Coprinellus micaceus]
MALAIMRFSTTIVLGAALAMTSSILALPMNVASDDASLLERGFTDIEGDVLEAREDPRLIETKTYKNGGKTIVKKTYARVVRVQGKPPIKKAAKSKVQKKTTSNSKTQKKSTSNSKDAKKKKATTSNSKAKATTTTSGASKPTGSSKAKAKASPSPTPAKGAKASSTATTQASKATGSAHKNKAAASATTTRAPKATASPTTTSATTPASTSPAVAKQTPSGDDWNHRHGHGRDRYFDRPSRYDRYREGRRRYRDDRYYGRPAYRYGY